MWQLPTTISGDGRNHQGCVISLLPQGLHSPCSNYRLPSMVTAPIIRAASSLCCRACASAPASGGGGEASSRSRQPTTRRAHQRTWACDPRRSGPFCARVVMPQSEVIRAIFCMWEESRATDYAIRGDQRHSCAGDEGPCDHNHRRLGPFLCVGGGSCVCNQMCINCTVVGGDS